MANDGMMGGIWPSTQCATDPWLNKVGKISRDRDSHVKHEFLVQIKGLGA
jgi:hypothetical protein